MKSTVLVAAAAPLTLICFAAVSACSATVGRQDDITAAVEAAEEASRTAPNQETGLDYTGSLAAMPMGSVCWAAILQAVSQFGERCLVRENPSFRASLDASVSRLDAHLLNSGWSEERLRAFKSQMGEEDTPTAELCGNSEALGIYRETERPGTGWLSDVTDKVLSSPGPPDWGTCL